MFGLKNIQKVKPVGLELKDKLVGVQRVTKVTKGGRAFSFSAIVVVGDEKSVIGYGLGRSKEVSSAIAKAIENAQKNLVRVSVINGTIPHAQQLFLSNHTINTHRKNIMAKLGVKNTAGIVMYAVKTDLISPNKFLFAAEV